jgi:hypothetical protein
MRNLSLLSNTYFIMILLYVSEKMEERIDSVCKSLEVFRNEVSSRNAIVYVLEHQTI